MIIKNSVIYLVSSMTSRGIPILLLPVSTRYLTPEEYGLLSIFFISVYLYTALIGMNMQATISRNFYKLERSDLSLYVGNILFVLIITFTIYFFLTWLINIFVDEIFSIPVNWLFAAPFLAVMSIVNELNTTILRNEQRAYMFGSFEVANTAIKMGATVIFLVVFALGWYSQVLGFIFGAFVFFIIGLAYMRSRSYICLSFDQEKFKSILKISIPLVPHALGGLVIVMSDRIFIEQMVGLEAVGLYSVGYSFGMIVSLFTDAFIKAWSPWFYKTLAEPSFEDKIRIVKFSYIFIAGIFFLAAAVGVFGNFILPYFVAPQFFEAGQYIFWVALGYAFRGVYQIFFPYLVHINRTSFLAASTVLAAIINLVLNYVLIDLFGAIGAAYATTGAYFVSAALVFLYQQRNYHMPWFFRVV